MAFEALLSARKEVMIECWKRGLYQPFYTDGNKINEKQGHAFRYLTTPDIREFAFGGAAGGSKSWTGCVWLMMMCLVYPEIRCFIGREELKRLRESTLITFFKVARYYGIKRDIDFTYNGQDHYIQFNNGSRIDLLDLAFKPSDPLYERYGSLEYTVGWIEEAGEVHFGAYDTLKSRCGRQYNEKYGIAPIIFVTLNPKKNWTHSYFWMPYKEKRMTAGRVFLPSLATDNPFLDEGYIAQLHAITDKVRRQRLLHGNFDYDDDELSLIQYDAISGVFRNDGLPAGRKCITVDMARQGGDRIVMGSWEGYRVRIKAWSKEYLHESGKRIEAERLAMGIGKHDVLIDEDGVGGGVVDYQGYKGFLNGGRPAPSPVNPQRDPKTGQPMPENYKNLKSQCSYRMASRINASGLYILDASIEYQELIKQEMEQVKRDVADSDGKLGVMSKADVKEALGRSPDFWDMLMMREWFDLTPTRRAVVA